MKKAYSYIRFSTPEQAKGDSLRRQIARTQEWCAARGVELDDTLQDLGVSAYTGANRTTGALRRFLHLVETGQIAPGSFLVVESLDRLSREAVMDAASRLFDLMRAGVAVVTLSDGQEYSAERLAHDWTPLIFSLVSMARAHEESKIKSERVAAAWGQKKARARVGGTPITSRCPEWLKLVGGTFVERPERVAVIKRIFRETIEGAGRREIVRRLNAEGIPAFRSTNGWQTSSIGKIIANRAVLGEYQPHRGAHRTRNREPDGPPIEGYYPPIIDEPVYWQAQHSTQRRRQGSAGRNGAVVPLLRGLAICKSCSSPMHLLNKGPKPKGGRYLACSNNIRSAGCEVNRKWKADQIEIALLEAVSLLDAQAFASLDRCDQNVANPLDVLQAQLTDARTRRDRLLLMAEMGDDAALQRFSEVSVEVKRLQTELDEAEASAAKAAANPDILKRLIDIAALRLYLDAEDLEERRRTRIQLASLLKGIVDRVECSADIGVVAILKPRLRWKVEGVAQMPIRATRTKDGYVCSALLNKDAEEPEINRFLGWDVAWDAGE